METITLHFEQKIKKKLLEVLEVFSKNELQIVEENTEFEKVKNEVHKEYKYTLQKDAVFYSIDEVEKMLDKSIKDNSRNCSSLNNLMLNPKGK